MANLCSWLFLLGPAPFCCLLCFFAGWRNAYLAAFPFVWLFLCSPFCVATNSFGAFSCELRHSGFSPLCPFLARGCFCWTLPRLLFCFVSLLDGEAHIWGICVSPFVVFLFVVVCAVDLPFYMTTGVNVDVILNCFFTCKDRASERDRPYQRKKTCVVVFVFVFCC